MPEINEKEKSRPDVKGVVEFIKDGLELVEKLVGGRNAMVAGTVGLLIGGGVGAVVVQPSEAECAEYVAKQQSDRSREALEKFLRAPVTGGF